MVGVDVGRLEGVRWDGFWRVLTRIDSYSRVRVAGSEPGPSGFRWPGSGDES